MLKAYSLTFFLLLSFWAKAQDEYTIFHNHAKFSLPSSLSELGELSIKKGDTAVILHSSGKLFTIQEKGKYKKGDLDIMLMQAESIMPSQQANYLVNSQLFTHGVEYRRVGVLPCKTDEASSIFFPERHTRHLVYGDSIIVSWDFRGELPRPDSCQVLIQELLGDTLTEIFTNTNFIEFSIHNITKGKELLGNKILIEIQNLESEEQRHISIGIDINLTSPKICPPIEAWLSENEENYLANALFFEEQSIPIDAYFSYKKAIAQSPEDMRIQFLFRMFKERNGIGKFGTW